MKKVMLMCNAGMSTSMLVKKIQVKIKEKGLDIHIWAISETEFSKEKDKADIILLGPQIMYMLDTVKAKVSVPVDVINVVDYGRMNAEAVLKQILQLLN